METYTTVGRTTTDMSNDPTVKTLSTVDNRSKVLAVVTTVIAFGAGMVAIGEIEFVSIAAAGVGIGVRFASVWVGARVFVESGSTTLRSQPAAGSYHHGAMGIALVASGSLALIGRYVGTEVTTIATAAAAVAVIAFVALSVLLPD